MHISTSSRGFGWLIHCGVEARESVLFIGSIQY
jgi:hypothetical protein